MKGQTNSQHRIGVIGLGNAGHAIASAFTRFTKVYGFDQAVEKREKASQTGVLVQDNLDAFSDVVDVAILSLPHPDISLSVTGQLLKQGSKPKLIIDTSTVTPQTSIECAALAALQNVDFVDAAIAGGVASMANGQMTFFMGGETRAKARAKPILELVAAHIYDLGKIGSGMGIKVVNNAVMHSLMVVLIEAFSMSKKLGVPSDTFISILNREEGLLRPLVHRVQERMRTANFDGGMSVTNARKDSCLALETAQQLAVPLFAISASHTPYEIAEASGLGDADYAILSTLWEDWVKVVFKETNKP